MAETTTTDPLSACLAGIRERRHRWLRGSGSNVMAVMGATADDVPRLLGAVEAVLERHQPRGLDPADRACKGCQDECLYCESDHEWPCPTAQAVSSALLGTGGSESGG